MSTITKDTVSIDLTAFKIILEKLAAQANIVDLSPDGPDLPGGWSNVGLFKNSNIPQDNLVVVQSQGFLAKGRVPQTDGTTIQVAVLAVGITWPKYLQYQFDGQFPQMAIPKNIAGNSVPADAKMMSVYVNAYVDLRTNLWNAALDNDVKNLPLYICGMSLGAPLAQLAALDLRRGNFGPNNERAPETAVSCYTFSTGNTANNSMATYYNRTALETNVVWTGDNLLKVDQFPLQPDNNDFTRLGNLDAISTPIPDNGDEPWWERGNPFYVKALGGTPAPNPPVKTTFTDPPKDFDQTLAYTLSTLTLAAYKFAQHPNLDFPTGSYTKVASVDANGSTFAYVFSSSDAIVIAIRGCITWQEFNQFTANSNFTHPSFDPTPAAHVQSGAYEIYTSPTTKNGKVTFESDLRTKVSAILGSKKLFITGHSLGGAIANIAAADYVMGSPKLNVTAVYTIGSIMTADPDFATDFNKALQGKTFQVRRVSDKLTSATYMLGYEYLDGMVTMNGELAVEELSRHSLYSYAQLLDPSRPK